MKTEKKFRGKSIDTGELVYGYGMCFNSEYNISVIIHKQAQNLMHHTEVIPDTLTEYTNFTDVNGKEIYDGDTVKLHGNIGIVEYTNNSYGNKWGWGIVYEKGEQEITFHYGTNKENFNDCEVIENN